MKAKIATRGFLILLKDEADQSRRWTWIRLERSIKRAQEIYIQSWRRTGEEILHQKQKAKYKDIRKMEIKKPRFLCFHGHASNAAILEEHFTHWPDYVLEKMDLVFIDGPFTVEDGLFDWFTKENNTYPNFDEGIAYIEDRMVELGPFDGVLGFSQGALLAGALPGMQEQGVCLTNVGKIEYAIIISGGEFGGRAFPAPELAETAFSSPINIPSLHIFGERDKARLNALELVEAYVDPLVIYHNGGHEVPKLDEEGLKIMFEFLEEINAIVDEAVL
ncbi:hypothetical protein L1987_45527 [Smallanthus sonchifolius]|uniref:Uncharacterized protein n=1 Tax=Smallanthus sonchifolius TaxID=185202 RepID=A0ACB9FXB1_9ASTR|nr:hypothetical protein L1987_45527 [Smallanthus sonchifolius]